MPALSLRIAADPDAAVALAAASIGRRLNGSRRRHGRTTVALSGGSTGAALAAALAAEPLGGAGAGWADVGVWQVDERVAPDGHPDRNVTGLRAFVEVGADVHEMPVTADDLDDAAAHYAAGLPDRFDVVHLGVGVDGHTASWPPDDPIVDTPADLLVAMSGRYQGRVRMSLLPRPVNAAVARVVVVTGADKATAVAAWVVGAPFDGDLPVRHVRRSATTLILDAAAASALPPGRAT